MNDLQRLLDMAVRWDKATTLKAREIIDGRLRELDEPITTDEYRAQTDQPWREGVPLLPEDIRSFNASEDDRLGHFDHPSEGAELQAGLEEAVRREQDSTG